MSIKNAQFTILKPAFSIESWPMFVDSAFDIRKDFWSQKIVDNTSLAIFDGQRCADNQDGPFTLKSRIVEPVVIVSGRRIMFFRFSFESKRVKQFQRRVSLYQYTNIINDTENKENKNNENDTKRTARLTIRAFVKIIITFPVQSGMAWAS